MTQPSSVRPPRPGRRIRKYFVSAFVVCTFAAYAFHERSNPAESSLSAVSETRGPAATQVALATTQEVPTAPPPPTPSIFPSAIPTERPASMARATDAPTAPPAEPPTAEPTIAPTVEPTVAPPLSGAIYRDGSYDGMVADAWYGNLQVRAVIKGGKIADVQFLDYPQDRRTSRRINSIAGPMLVEEVIQAQTAEVDLISGATLTSQAFVESLRSALDSARVVS